LYCCVQVGEHRIDLCCCFLTYKVAALFFPLAALGPRKIQQPLLSLPFHTYLPIAFPLQTSPRHVAVRLDILDQTFLAHIVILGPDEAQNQQVERRAVEVSGKGVQDVDLNAAFGVFVEGVEADRKNGFVDVAAGGGGGGGRRWRGGRGVARWKFEADEAVVNTRGEVGVGGQAGGRDVGSWDAEL
jgi:hypothetical protein